LLYISAERAKGSKCCEAPIATSIFQIKTTETFSHKVIEMKGFFRRLGSPSGGKAREVQQSASPEDTSQQLALAESLLEQIRGETGANFPLLNNATRLGMQLPSYAVM